MSKKPTERTGRWYDAPDGMVPVFMADGNGITTFGCDPRVAGRIMHRIHKWNGTILDNIYGEFQSFGDVSSCLIALAAFGFITINGHEVMPTDKWAKHIKRKSKAVQQELEWFDEHLSESYYKLFTEEAA